MELSTSMASQPTLTGKLTVSGTIPVIPTEILDQIIRDAYSSEDAKSTIISCLLVSRQWRDVTLPFLYKDVVLAGSDRMERFLTAHDDSAVRSITRSLTLYLRENGGPSHELQERVDTTVSRLAKEVMPNMAALQSFSLTTDRREFKLGILKATISDVLKSLPECCVNLELDTEGKDEESFWLAYTGQDYYPIDVTHVCDDIRYILPRMHNVRIDLKSMCNAMLGLRSRGQPLHPIALPNIRHLLIETTGTGGRPPCPTWYGKDHSSWRQIILALKLVSGLPETAQGELAVLGSALHIPSGKTSYQTLLRCQVKGSDGKLTTFAFPATQATPPDRSYGRSLLVRTDEGGFVLDRINSYYDLAGGRPWRLAANGARLPVSLFPDTIWASDEKLGIYTEEEWRKRYPWEFPLWGEERTKGMRLMEFEEREEDIRLITVVERTPEGLPWVQDVESEEEEENVRDDALYGYFT
ncbi:F-box domain-containing protein [Fusarium sp. LHS14.1]|nr:F-box domain-containing protein [Fusarium sp. LHS14.1]